MLNFCNSKIISKPHSTTIMPLVILCAMLLVFSSVGTARAISIIDNSDITVFGTVFNTHIPDHTIDDDLSTFWHGTNDIQIDMTDFLAYRFSSSYSVTRIDFYDNYTNSYKMGELDIQISQNSTDGLDGNWSTIDHIAGDFNPANGDFTRLVDTGYTSWIRLLMNYQGSFSVPIWSSKPLPVKRFHHLTLKSALKLKVIIKRRFLKSFIHVMAKIKRSKNRVPIFTDNAAACYSA